MSDFSNKLKYLRKEKGLTQNELALALNISRATIGHWEINRSQPSLEELVKLSNYFNCTLDYLIDSSVSKTHILHKNGINEKKYREIQKEAKEEVDKERENNYHD